MRLHAPPPARFPSFFAMVMASGLSLSNEAVAAPTSSRAEGPSGAPSTIGRHTVRVDATRKLLPWPRGDSPYAQIVALAWGALETRFATQNGALETWLGWSRFDPETFEGVSWPHNPAGLYAMLADSAVRWYAFSGDRAAVDLVRKALDYQLAHGTTPDDGARWEWALTPYASAGAGDVEYRGADDDWCDYCGRGDGIGVIEPDKVGELGFAYLRFYELTGEERYRDAAVACANALAQHVRPGDARHSPWPFRVHARTNVAREEYSSNVVGALTLFDELMRLSTGDVDAYGRARALAFEWMMRFPMKNDRWSGYFEDVAVQPDPDANPNQYSALRAAQWLMAHAEYDPQWRFDVGHLLAWAARTFGGDTPTESGRQWGAMVMSEQFADMAKMASHTARFGATNALWFQATGDAAARDRAARSLNWATYACDTRGVVAVGEAVGEGWWFSDGYGDYVRHFLVAMGAVPEWAPAGENHVLSSTSVLRDVVYAPSRVSWSTFDADSTETLRLASLPETVSHGGEPLRERRDLSHEGFTVSAARSGGAIVRVRHMGPGETVVCTKSVSAPPTAVVRATDPRFFGEDPASDDGAAASGGPRRSGASRAALALFALPLAIATWLLGAHGRSRLTRQRVRTKTLSCRSRRT